jgi:organic radical activating enzyme
MLTSDAIVERIMEILPHKQMGEEHLVITGGEPLLGWQRVIQTCLIILACVRLKEITFETNGTQELTNEFEEYLLEWQMPGQILLVK